MSDLNEIIHQPVRLRIMAALNVLGPQELIEFTRLRKLVGTTDGNLGAHLDTLEKAHYISIEKRFVGKKPQTRVKATPAGRRAFTAHAATLREIFEAAT
ncbi:MAG TPA: transcriptional regulator [bacterium]|nr:transcriptional regulator [bacterium]